MSGRMAWTGPLIKLRLVRKLAERLNGVDLTNCSLGDLIEREPAEAAILVLNGWAVVEDPAVAPVPSLASPPGNPD